MKYFNQLKKLKNLIHFEQQVEKRIKIKKNLILKILKQSDQTLLIATETYEAESTSELISNSIENEIKHVEKKEENTDKKIEIEKPAESKTNQTKRPNILELEPNETK